MSETPEELRKQAGETFAQLDDELIKSATNYKMKASRAEMPRISTYRRSLSGGGETSGTKGSGKAKVKFSSTTLEAKPHKRYSEKPGKKYTRKEQQADLKRAIKEEMTEKLESAGEANSNPTIPRSVALKGKKTVSVTTPKGTYTTPKSNVIVGIHGKDRYDVKIVKKKLVYKS